MAEFILNLRDATKLETGVYQWSFGTRNEIRPDRLVVGPCSVTVGTDQREITVLSDSFRNDRKTHTLHHSISLGGTQNPRVPFQIREIKVASSSWRG